MNLVDQIQRQFQELSKIFLNCIFEVSINLDQNNQQLLRLEQIIKQAAIDILEEFPLQKEINQQQKQIKPSQQSFQIKIKGRVEKQNQNNNTQQENTKALKSQAPQEDNKIEQLIPQITLKQPFNQTCFLCQNNNILKQQTSKIINDNQYFYHMECFTKAKFNHLGMDKMLEIFKTKICKICNKKGAYYQCENCELWYHYVCMSELYQNNKECIDCPCKPIDIFQAQEIDIQVEDVPSKKKIKIDHISQNTDLFSDISFKKELKLM
ncbi:unnamed protein product [Paramecium pentaurelia]|uniref:Uncharacterized protein n=1 Tax=Paramecium pentaurelia TaxID=43138 RepID=A0A8S1U6Y9_9CILI|nr:unnamed protein product [Paramecium pentaurelia]